MANTWKSKYGTVINVAGMSPEQLKEVQRTAEANGAYGSKAMALADAFRKKNKASQQTQNPAQNPTQQTNPNIVDDNTGKINENNFYSAKPDIYGQNIAADAEKARTDTYNFLSRNFAGDKQQERDAEVENLANRGIPFSEDPNSPYQMALKRIDEKYSDLDFQAKNQSTAAANDTISTLSGASKNASDSFLAGVFGMSDAELKKYGIDQDFRAKLKQIAAAARNRGSGDSGSNIVIGGNAPGF